MSFLLCPTVVQTPVFWDQPSDNKRTVRPSCSSRTLFRQEHGPMAVLKLTRVIQKIPGILVGRSWATRQLKRTAGRASRLHWSCARSCDLVSMMGSALRLYFAVTLFLSVFGTGTALRCYGSNAFVKAKLGDKDCYDFLSTGLGAYWNPCWARCGGVTLFSHNLSQARYLIPYEDPTNQTLCPYRASGVNATSIAGLVVSATA